MIPTGEGVSFKTRIGIISGTQCGKGPVLVLLHANPGDSRDYQDILGVLALRYQVLALDWPGYGKSPLPLQKASAVQYAHALSDVLEQIPSAKVTLLGNSLGGFAALFCALQNPRKVERLVLVAPGGLTSMTLLARLFCRGMALDRVSKFAVSWLPRFYLKGRNPLCLEIIGRARSLQTDFPRRAIYRQIWRSFTDPEHNLRDKVKALSVPALFVFGKKDPLFHKNTVSLLITQGVAENSICLLDSGHQPYAENPSEFLAAVRNFLSL